MLADLARTLLHASGALGLYHRWRNARTLTVVGFHRVLDPADPRWASCDPDYTLPTTLLAQSLAFFRRHYNVVSLAQVVDASRGVAALPPRALLVTFDDGWADNAEFALPALREAGVPAAMFVVADAVGRHQPFFQEQLVSAWRRGTVTVAELVRMLDAHGGGKGDTPARDESLPALRAVIARMEDLEPAARACLLAPLAGRLDDGRRHMVDVEELERLQQGGVALGLHGKTHIALTRAPDLEAELSGARDALAGHLAAARPPAPAMSFPHGAHDEVVVARVREAGYALAFTSVPVLNPASPTVGWLLGRTGFEGGTVVDARGRFRPERLALYLFRRPHQRLA